MDSGEQSLMYASIVPIHGWHLMEKGPGDGELEVRHGEQPTRGRCWLGHLTRLTIARAAVPYSRSITLQRME
jgi:hypothetical protein